MKSITINGSKRESVGKSSTKALRNAGKVPCVLYGGESPIHFSALEIDFRNLVYTPNAHTTIIKLEDGMEINAILQDIQFHPVNDSILHIDFFQLFEDKEISMNIPVKIEGSSPGVLNSGGTLFINKRKLKIKALPSNLPDYINIDISKMELGDKVYTADMKKEEYSFLHSDNTVICQVKISRASMSLPEDEIDETEELDETSEETTSEEGSKEASKEGSKEGSKESSGDKNENKGGDKTTESKE
tara:strand:- start:3013 stop:3747 length:735 start_codon:yes stop_codon:yes gene_type:complete